MLDTKELIEQLKQVCFEIELNPEYIEIAERRLADVQVNLF